MTPMLNKHMGVLFSAMKQSLVVRSSINAWKAVYTVHTYVSDSSTVCDLYPPKQGVKNISLAPLPFPPSISCLHTVWVKKGYVLSPLHGEHKAIGNTRITATC